MTTTVPIPDGLVDLPPGPELSRVLADIDLSLLSGWDCVEVLKAQYRQVNHERARLMATMVEVGLCDVGPDDQVRRVTRPGEFAPDEVRAALVLTRRAADQQFWLAYDLRTRLPAVHAAMDAGWLDEPRARIFSDWTADLTSEQARTLCAGLLPRVGELTTGQLIEQIKKRAIALDPEWARRRYQSAVADRKVIGSRNPDGSANLSGVNLPLDRVAAASARIDALAHSANNAGDTRPIDHIRADLFLGMTDGTYTGLDDPTIVALLRADAADGWAGAAAGPESKPAPATGADDSAGTEDDAAVGPEPVREATPCGRAAQVGGVELRVQLSTLLGYDDHPGELAGWGPVHAELARDLAAGLAGARWAFAITDTHGRLLHAGITRRRPTGSLREERSRHVVELQIPETLLAEIAEVDTGAWTPVIADLTHQHTHRDPDAYAADAGRRTPGAALRRHLQIRDRRCIGPGCRAPARTADQDHTIDHEHGGTTTDDNLGPACRHDHRLKHEGGWRLHQPRPGQFTWTSRLGHRYDVRPPRIIDPLPEPMPAARPPDLPAGVIDDPGPTPEPPPPEPEPRLEPDPSGDVPPF